MGISIESAVLGQDFETHLKGLKIKLNLKLTKDLPKLLSTSLFSFLYLLFVCLNIGSNIIS